MERTVKYTMLAVAAAILMSACTSREQIERHDAIPPYPEPYRAQLQKEFLMLADREAARNDHLDAKRFLLRAEAAARAVTIYPHKLSAYDVEPQYIPKLEQARAQLVTLLDGGKLRAPKDLARAHAAFECWLEEAEEGHQTADITWCRDRFDEAVTATRRESGLDADWSLVLRSDDGHVGAVELGGASGKKTLLDSEGASGFVHEGGDSRDADLTRRENSKMTKGAMAMLPAPAKQFLVYFETGSARLSEDARATLVEAAADAADRPAPDVEILGYADAPGEITTNLTLSRARAEAVHSALAGMDVPEDAFLIYAIGEVRAKTGGADSGPEQTNRRVEITVR